MKKTKYLLWMLLLVHSGIYAQQSWNIGGNNLSGGGDDKLLGNKSAKNKNLVFINGSSKGTPTEQGRITYQGRWGIGTMLPASRFHINSNANQSPLLVQINGQSKINVGAVGSITLGTPEAFGYAPENNVVFVPERLGIGTSHPYVKLQVTGGTDASLLSGGYIVAGSISSNNLAIDDNEIMARINGTAATLYLNYDGGDVNVSNGALAVNASSNSVGIGTINPAVKLQVLGGTDASAAAGGYIMAGAANSNNVVLDNNEIMARNNGATAALYLNHEGGDVNVSNGALVVDASTNRVGIGAITPAAKLHVLGGTDASLSGGGHIITGSTGSENIVIDNNEIISRNNGSTSPLYLNAPGGNIVLCRDAGKVTIGTASPANGYILSVDGKAIFEEVKVQLSSAWPDYVFDKDYQLPSLYDIESSIKADKHLPGISSAKELNAQGVSLGAMQIKMMEKIEELTLYIIGLQKQIDGLKKLN